MKDEVYEYLINYGFNKDNLNKMEQENEDIYFISLNKVRENIEFFLNKGLTNLEIINLININSFNITLSLKRKNSFEKIYINKLNLSNEEIKHLLNLNNNIYTCSPVELDKIINYLSRKYSYDNIKKILLTNPNIINKKLDEIVGII